MQDDKDSLLKFSDEFKIKAFDFIVQYCFSVTLNQNDTWSWACADGEDVYVEYLDDILYLFEKYSSAGIDAFVAHKRSTPDKPFRHYPDITGYYSPKYFENFNAALEEIKDWKIYQ